MGGRRYSEACWLGHTPTPSSGEVYAGAEVTRAWLAETAVGSGSRAPGGLGRARATSRKGPGSRLRGLSLLLCQHGVRASEPPDAPWFGPASPPGETRELTHRSLIITVATVIYVFESEVSWEDGTVGLRRRHYDSMCVDIGEWSPRRLANAPPSQSDAVFCDGSFENLLS